MQISQCGGRERVLYATHQLTGAIADWWTAFTAALDDPDNISWTDFKTAFRNHHVPAGEIKLKRREFLDLKQGSMTV